MNQETLTFDQNKTYQTDSGLGGIFQLRFTGFSDGKFTFDNISPGFQSWKHSYTPEEAKNKIEISKNN